MQLCHRLLSQPVKRTGVASSELIERAILNIKCVTFCVPRWHGSQGGLVSGNGQGKVEEVRDKPLVLRREIDRFCVPTLIMYVDFCYIATERRRRSKRRQQPEPNPDENQ